MLLELAKTEGYAQMSNVHMNSKPVETINKDFVDKLPETGVFEGTYICQQANIRDDIREKLGVKYLDWDVSEEVPITNP
jgi:hypothetical protein